MGPLLSFKNLKLSILRAKRIVLSTHLLPDGDGLGAETALFHYLKQAQKSCRIYNPDSLPGRYRFLDLKITQPWNSFDLWIIVDTNDPRRLGTLWEKLYPRAQQIIFLDHHPEILGAGKIKYPPHASLVCDSKSSSIGELLYHLFYELNLNKRTQKTQINPNIALGLYVSIMTDTNSFRYAQTTPLAHRIAGEMIQAGINPEEIYQAIYSSKEISHVRLLGKMLQGLRVARGGQIAWLEMTLALRKSHQASADDTQSFLNLLLLLRDAEIVCFFREEEDGSVRVSIKSKGRIAINQLAMDLGGGGHEFAAGVALSLSLKKSVKWVIGQIEDLIIKFQK